jgi:hypothetical protein
LYRSKIWKLEQVGRDIDKKERLGYEESENEIVQKGELPPLYIGEYEPQDVPEHARCSI